LPALWS